MQQLCEKLACCVSKYIKMKPAVVLFVAFALILLSYSVSIGKPQPDDLEDAEEDGRRGYAVASAHAASGANQYRPDPPPGPQFLSPPGPNQLAPAIQTLPNECYACTDCPQILSNTSVKLCGFNAPRCVVYSEKYNYLPKPVYIRGCVNERGTCDDVRRAHEGHQNVVKLLSCSECVGNKCNTNGVTRSLPDLATALFFLIVTPVVAKCVLT